MAGIKGKNTKPEMAIRSLLHRAGFRFRLHRKDLPGRPDIVLPKFRTAIFVNGCYWHGHERCALYRPPLSRTGFWTAKISGNRERDARKTAELLTRGWRVIVIWECALKGRGRLEENFLIETLTASILSACVAREIRGAIVG